MKLRTIAMAGVLGVAGLGLVGTGAHAVFTATTSSAQTITAGNLSVVLSVTDPAATGNGTPNLTLGPLGPTGSSFMTTPELITITNNGNIPATEVALQLSDQNTNTTLQGETWACLYSDGSGGGGVFFNEPLPTVEGYGQAAIGHLTLAPGATDTYTVVYYAGPTEATGCGTAYSGYQAVAYGGYPGAYYSAESYTGAAPALGLNPAVTSLAPAAEGGSVTPKVTVSYTG
jgi:predicted ribosomally synthesized peptide with SipW-like signal peptide